MAWIILWFLMLIIWIGGFVVAGFTLIWFGIGFITMLFLTVSLVYFGLAKLDWFFTFIDEGTGKVVVRGNEFDKTMIAWKDHYIDKKTWDVKEEKTRKRLFGGLRFYGIPPFQKILVYHFRWSHLHEDGIVKEHNETIEHILLKTDLYVITLPLVSGKEESVKGAEDINGVPLGISIVLPMKIVNPYKALFIARRWLQMISGIVEAKARRFVANYRYKEDLLNMRAGEDIEDVQKKAGIKGDVGPGVDLWKKFWEGLKDAFSDEGGRIKENGNIEIYGVEIEEKKTGVLRIDPPPKYRELSTLKYEADQEAKRIKITAAAKGKAISERVRKPTWEIAKDLVGIRKEDKDLTQEEVKKISNRLEEAWSNYLEDAAIQAVSPLDKIIVTEGKGIGRTVGRDTAREMIRKEISKERKK